MVWEDEPVMKEIIMYCQEWILGEKWKWRKEVKQINNKNKTARGENMGPFEKTLWDRLIFLQKERKVDIIEEVIRTAWNRRGKIHQFFSYLFCSFLLCFFMLFYELGISPFFPSYSQAALRIDFVFCTSQNLHLFWIFPCWKGLQTAINGQFLSWLAMLLEVSKEIEYPNQEK